jgi:hypothetical protein
VLIKDVMNFFNSCAVAKVCRDGKEILALPSESFEEVSRIAKKTDAQALLRATEIFAETEQALKYSASPRILFETAVLKASMPKEDYDISSLFVRIAELERKLEQGCFVQNDGGRVALNDKKQEETTAQTPSIAPTIVQEKTVKKVQEESFDDYGYADIDVPPEMDVPPDTGEGNVYFDEGFMPKPVSKPVSKPVAKPVEKPLEKPVQTPAPAPIVSNASATAKPVVKAAVQGDGKSTFGSFLRYLRKLGKSGVLFTICMDLDYAYEGSVFTLYTQSDTIYRSLTKSEHYAILKETFAGIGIDESGFSVQLKGKETDDFNKNVEEIKSTFSGVKVEIK